MAERVFCVDFGTFYTKVALRSAPQEAGALVPCSDEGLEFWAPTVVSADWTRGEARLEFGHRAADVKPGGKVVVYSNFKRELFAPPPAQGPDLHPIDALLRSEEFEALAAKHGVLPAWVAGLRSLTTSARTLFGTPDASPGGAAARRQEEAKRLTYHYFKWLRECVLKACERLPHTALNYKDIPLRITVPLFGPIETLAQHPGCVRLRDALASAGWPLADPLFVSEPEANAVGILTKAVNALTVRTKKINFREMFNRGPLITVLAGDAHHPTYRALVIDVGTFTSDFAALGIDTGGKEVDTSNGAGFGVTQQSIAFGISDLDATVRDALPEEKRAALNGMARKDFAAFQVSAYSAETGYRIGPGKVIGGSADRPIVESCLAAFCTRLTDETTAFLQQLGPASMQELILTGGGSNIPAVREALIKAAAATPGAAFVKTHAPGLKKVKSGPPVDSLDDKFARGATALGGASLYFEREYF
ncbi:hypothetical protein GobsT_28690 [Gemmata obscuriglobus]|uniref:Hsp70 family protein n=1 Tax=Gemmata obscuriglobus TaxID=114 RepID=A0A2Z3H3K1_9BACT|nr:hypothetical protein [Gemmata obscuriglobus]AWM38902.1 hypothetical protein C1280_19200 [Gemmata obscuriglobus]QEG28096.1 hypothetical protein GobsT_28690 [Gemmata obscuriglobus]VTS05725.1 unnamed protein product [Gemmata obscuriglobus UQM 2246]